MSYSFDAQPRVVQHDQPKQKFKNEDMMGEDIDAFDPDGSLTAA